MKRFSLPLAIIASLVVATAAMAHDDGARTTNKLRTEVGEPATAVITSRTSATLDVGEGGYAAVFRAGEAPFGIKLKYLKVGFVASPTSTVAGGAPRFSLPIDTNHNGKWDLFAFIDVNSCAGDHWVSTENPVCSVYVGSEHFDNWAALAAAHPRWRMATKQRLFIISDAPGHYELSSIDLR